LLLSRDKPIWYDQQQQIPAVGPFIYQVHCLRPTGWEVGLTLSPSPKQYSFVQPLPGGRWLLVESRLGKDRAPNADIFDEQGNLLSSILVGDGIEHVQATSAGEIWVGYFDEGVYCGSTLEHSGLVCLVEKGQPCLQYWPDIAELKGLPPIDDCYALNVSGEDEVWVDYYSNFPLVRLRDKKLSHSWLDWPAKAVRAFAVHGDRLLMTPAYRREGPLSLVNLQDSSTEEIQVVDSDGQPLLFDHSFGRGPLLCLVSLKAPEHQGLFTIDLTEI
jgi:hypothetical protein